MLREQTMQNFTYEKIKQIDEDVGTTERILRELQQSSSGEGLKLAEAVAFEMKKMRF